MADTDHAPKAAFLAVPRGGAPCGDEDVGEVPFLPLVPQRFRSHGGGGLGHLLIPDVRPVPLPSDECGDVHTHSAERAAYSAPAKRRGKKTQGARGVVHGTNPIAPQGRAHGHTSGAAPSDLLSAQRPDAGAAPGIGKDNAGYGVDTTPGACMVPQPGAGLLHHGITVAPGDLADKGLSPLLDVLSTYVLLP